MMLDHRTLSVPIGAETAPGHVSIVAPLSDIPEGDIGLVKQYAGALGLDRGYPMCSMRATFITTALENGAQLERCAKSRRSSWPSTTKLYDRHRYIPKRRQVSWQLTDFQTVFTK